jgi:hypothetical protein
VLKVPSQENSFDLVKEGTLITPQTPMAIIGQENSFLLNSVDENDMVRVRTDAKSFATITKVGFDAELIKFYPIMNERSCTFKIEAHFIKPPEELYPNLTAEATLSFR